jgi:hypothetical protein
MTRMFSTTWEWSNTRHGRACPGHPRLCTKKDVDARHLRAFTPVFDGLWPGMTALILLAPFLGWLLRMRINSGGPDAYTR